VAAWRSASRTAAPLLWPDLRTRRRPLVDVLRPLEVSCVALAAAKAGQLGRCLRLGVGDGLAEPVQVDRGQAEVEAVIALQLAGDLADIRGDQRDDGATGAGAGGAP
jgi:hypothetical protein